MRTLGSRLRRRIAARIRGICGGHFVQHSAARFSRENLSELLDQVIEPFETRPGAKRVLNIGAGGPLAARVARIRGCTVVSVDLDPARGPDVVVDASDLRCFADGSFDAVFLLEVLEHVAAPDRALQEVHRVLRPDGLLVVSTPFVFEIHDAPHDYYRFTEHGLRHLMREFRHCRITRRNGYAKSTVVPWLRLTRSPHIGDNLFGLVALFATLALAPLLALLDRAIRSDAATTGYVASGCK
jgi:SAM-dependent methyltransferase